MGIKNVFKWRVTSTKYLYLIDEENIAPFILNKKTGNRYYPVPLSGDTVEDITEVTGMTLDEGLISQTVAQIKSATDYSVKYDRMVELAYKDDDASGLTFLDYTKYFNLDGDECIEEAVTPKCEGYEPVFNVSAYTETAKTEVEYSFYADKNESDKTLRYNLKLGIPRGEKGEKGDYGVGCKGDDGLSAEIGNVTATIRPLEYWQNPTVSVTTSSRSGDNKNIYDFAFGFAIPRGEKGEPGDYGDEGPQGPTGKSARLVDVDVETVTLSPEQDAYIHMTDFDCYENIRDGYWDTTFTLECGIPRGAKGDPGDPGLNAEIRNVTAAVVATLDPGSNAEAGVNVTPTGGGNVVDLDFWFKIPRGENGAGGGGTGTLYRFHDITDATDTRIGYFTDLSNLDGTHDIYATILNSGGGGGGTGTATPIGTIVAYSSDDIPTGWLLCDGSDLNSGSYAINPAYDTLRNLLGDTFNLPSDDYSVIRLPDLRVRFPLGAAKSKYDKMVVIWKDFVPSSVKYVGLNEIYLNDVIDSSGNKKTDIPSWANTTQLVLLFNRARDTIYNLYLNKFITSNYLLGNKDGEYEHTLTVDELAKHSHDISFRMYATGGTEYYFTNAFTAKDTTPFGYSDVGKIEETGSDYGHNNIPPYLAVNFIIKAIETGSGGGGGGGGDCDIKHRYDHYGNGSDSLSEGVVHMLPFACAKGTRSHAEGIGNGGGTGTLTSVECGLRGSCDDNYEFIMPKAAFGNIDYDSLTSNFFVGATFSYPSNMSVYSDGLPTDPRQINEQQFRSCTLKIEECVLEDGGTEGDYYVLSYVKISFSYNGINYQIPFHDVAKVNDEVNGHKTILYFSNSSEGGVITDTANAIGIATHTEGNAALAYGDYSHAEGSNVRTDGVASHAEGGNTRAVGDFSHAGGFGTIANNDYMTAIGKFNNTDLTSDVLFVIGNGTDDRHRINVLSVNGNGSITANDNHNFIYSSKEFNFAKNYSSGAESIYLNYRGVSSGHYIYDWYFCHGHGDDENESDPTRGTKLHAGAYYASSDERRKDVVEQISLKKAYELVEKCQTIYFTWKNDEKKKVEIGLLAQEVQKYFPEIVSENNEGYLSLDYSKLTVILMTVIKDLTERVKNLETLEERIKRLEEKMN